MTIFCQIDQDLIKVIRKQARGRVVVDCGCGLGLLGSMMSEVISVDIFHQEGELIPDVIHMDLMEFPFSSQHMPIFIRPCHGWFVNRVLTRIRAAGITDCLYISIPRNLPEDISLGSYEVREVSGWAGQNGERVYAVQCNEDQDTTEFVKVRAYGHVGWYKTLSSGWLQNPNGGQMAPDDATVLERTTAKRFEDLDWTGTYWDDPNAAEGWLAPDGRFWGCTYMAHAQAAYYALKSDEHELMTKGYVRVNARGTTGPMYFIDHNREPTEQQREWLLKEGCHDMS